MKINAAKTFSRVGQLGAGTELCRRVDWAL